MAALRLDSGNAIILIVLIALPIGAFAFSFAGSALKTLGKGPLSIDEELNRGGPEPQPISPRMREEEIRQMVEAKSFRRVSRGEPPIDVDAEVARLLSEPEGPALGQDKALREEVRQLVVARNERRMRRGEKPLEVEAEVERQLKELESLGQ